jgi:hypothetical protein
MSWDFTYGHDQDDAKAAGDTKHVPAALVPQQGQQDDANHTEGVRIKQARNVGLTRLGGIVEGDVQLCRSGRAPPRSPRASGRTSVPKCSVRSATPANARGRRNLIAALESRVRSRCVQNREMHLR